jgi:hypothetical protein
MADPYISGGLSIMARSNPRQRKIEGRVMHEFKHGELRSGRGGKDGKVKSRRQAIAIALREAGASKYDSARENRRHLRRTERKEARGQTYQQEREGKSHVGARGRRESSRAMGGKFLGGKFLGGKNARKTTARGRRAARSQAHGGPTKAALYQRARRRHIAGRSRMTKRQLQNALA